MTTVYQISLAIYLISSHGASLHPRSLESAQPYICCLPDLCAVNELERTGVSPHPMILHLYQLLALSI